MIFFLFEDNAHTLKDSQWIWQRIVSIFFFGGKLIKRTTKSHFFDLKFDQQQHIQSKKKKIENIIESVSLNISIKSNLWRNTFP